MFNTPWSISCRSSRNPAVFSSLDSAPLLVSRFHLLHDLRLTQKSTTTEPHFANFATVVADEANRLAMAAIAPCKRDPALITAPHLQLARVHERIEVRWARDHHLASHRDEVDRTPEGPPASRPPTYLAHWGAVAGEG